jgi:two-component system, OmpR family, KDP operon response regulator KdpE
MPKVLLVDDEAQVRRSLRAGFELQGFVVLEAEDATGGLKAAIFNTPDLIILDNNLPDLEGSEVLERIRSWSNVPIIVLSTQADEREKVRLFGLGADDCVVKPFGISELMARSEATLRRQSRNTNRDPVVNAGQLSIDLVSRLVTLEGERVQLTRKEYALVRALATYAGHVVTHQQLIKEIWGDHPANVQYLRTLVRKLRQKVEIDPMHPLLIVSESGVGYRLDLRATVDSRGRRGLSPDTTYRA